MAQSTTSARYIHTHDASPLPRNSQVMKASWFPSSPAAGAAALGYALGTLPSSDARLLGGLFMVDIAS